MRAIQKCNFLLNLSHCIKSYGHLCHIYKSHSSTMVMSRDPGFKFRKFLFSPNSIINFRTRYQIWGKLKVMGIYAKFTKATHQIWSCHLTNFRKSCQIWGKLAQEQKSYRQKQIVGGKHPPPPPPVLMGSNN